MLFTLRICIPDLPGTLGAVATAFGKGGANILTMDVVERDAGMAVDDMTIEAPEGMQEALRLAQLEVPGLVVEELRPVEAFRDFMAPLDLAAALAEAGESPVAMLVERLPEALWSDWCVVVSGEKAGMTVIASSIGAPSLEGVKAPWLPLKGPTRLPLADWMPSTWREGPAARSGQGKFDLAAAPFSEPSSAVMVGRRKGPQYRAAELTQLGLLARIAGVRAGGEEA
ncbi:MAG: amino acid-binding protein [Actinomycetota bacterium]|nr:amino acid-binding protein [Actinomycetota bacterium]